MKTIYCFIFLSVFSSALWACDKPTAPTLPDPETAVTPQMIKAKHELTAFLKAAETYLDCIDDDRNHNLMVDEMEVAAKAFNSIVQQYKNRMQKG